MTLTSLLKVALQNVDDAIVLAPLLVTFRVSRIDDGKCILATRVCVCVCVCVCLSVCLSVRRRMPTQLHGPGCNLGEW